jgi:DNA-nicking Smr family endonuclease
MNVIAAIHILEAIIHDQAQDYTPCVAEYTQALNCVRSKGNDACLSCIYDSLFTLDRDNINSIEDMNIICGDVLICVTEKCDLRCSPEWNTLYTCAEEWAEKNAEDADICPELGLASNTNLDRINSTLFLHGWISLLITAVGYLISNNFKKNHFVDARVQQMDGVSPENQSQERTTPNIHASENYPADALIEHGETIYKNQLAKNAKDGCPICLREFSGELSTAYAIVLPCGEHAVCANCTCSLKIEADKAKDRPQCPLCRYSFDPSFVEGVPSQLIEKDQNISNSILKLPDMDVTDKIAIAERLMWTHRFDVAAVLDAIESLLDGAASGCLFRNESDLTREEKCAVYNQARAPVKRLEHELEFLIDEQRTTFDHQVLHDLSCKLKLLRSELLDARQKARDEIYNRLNSVGDMGAEREGQDGSLVKVDFHGMHVHEMRQKFKDHIVPILPVVKRVLIITGRGVHSVGNESKLRKALFRQVSQYDDRVYWQQVEKNQGALMVLWRTDVPC